MKKLIFTLSCFALMMQFSFAQHNADVSPFGIESKDSALYNDDFTSGLTTVCTDPITGNNFSGIYVSDSGWVSGSNIKNDQEKLEKYLVQEKIEITHVIAFFYSANTNGGDDTVKALIHNRNKDVIDSSATMNLSDIANVSLISNGLDNSANANYVVFDFGAFPIYYSDSLYFGITLPTVAGDSLAVASTSTDCSATGQLAWDRTSNGSYQTTNSHWGRNIDYMIFPVYYLDPNLTAVSTGVTLNGLTLNAAYPNPTSGSVDINYAIDQSSNVKIEIYNTVGQQVMSELLGNQNPGKYTQNIDMSKLAKGTYFYSIVTDNSKLFGQIAVQ